MPEVKSESLSALLLGGTRTTEYCLEKKKKNWRNMIVLKKTIFERIMWNGKKKQEF